MRDAQSVTSDAPLTRREAREREEAANSDQVASRRAALTAGIVALGAAGVALAGSTIMAGGGTATLGGSAQPGATTMPSSKPTGGLQTKTVSVRATRLPGNPKRLGAPRSPASQNPPIDRDTSYATAGAEDQNTGGTSNQPPPVNPFTYDPSTPEARRHILQRAGIATGAAAMAEIEAMGFSAWLEQQLDPAGVDAIDPTLRAMWPLAFADIPTTRDATATDETRYAGVQALEQSVLARRLFGSRQIYEVVVDVMANLLNVPMGVDKPLSSSLADYHLNVIRAHAFGRYADMLHASARHPAMMVFLDNKDSRAADVNENYGRELLELHTVGVGSGYTEDDVRSSAIIMSGRREKEQEFLWDPKEHAIGPVTVLGFSDANATADGGLDVGDRYIDYLAHHPSTAATVARKLAIRFVSDTPSAELLAQLQQVYLDNDTNIRSVVVAIFNSAEFWSSKSTKLRRPMDDFCGVARCLGVKIEDIVVRDIVNMLHLLRALGDAPIAWKPPDGYPDVAQAWLGASQVSARWDRHREFLGGHREHFGPSQAFVDGMTPAAGITVRAWADQLSNLILGEAVDERDLGAAATFLGLGPDDAISQDHAKQKADLAALFFDSPRYILR